MRASTNLGGTRFFAPLPIKLSQAVWLAAAVAWVRELPPRGSPRFVERPWMSALTLYHNPKCRKSRTALARLEERALPCVAKSAGERRRRAPGGGCSRTYGRPAQGAARTRRRSPRAAPIGRVGRRGRRRTGHRAGKPCGAHPPGDRAFSGHGCPQPASRRRTSIFAAPGNRRAQCEPRCGSGRAGGSTTDRRARHRPPPTMLSETAPTAHRSSYRASPANRAIR